MLQRVITANFIPYFPRVLQPETLPEGKRENAALPPDQHVQRHAQGSSDRYLDDDHNAIRVAANRIGALCRVERVLKSS